MTTELRRGGIFTKIKLKGYIKDITNNQTSEISVKAIKQNKSITYYTDKEKYILKIISPIKLILNRNNTEIESTIYFETHKILPANYFIKENGLSLSIDIRTNKIEQTDQYIKIMYTVIDSNNDYEYYIEMSE